MENLCLPSSPNWYCNRILDCNDDGLLAFGSRHCIVLLNCREIPKSSPTFIGCFAAHNERVSGIAFCPFEGQTNLLASVGDDRAVVVTDTVNKTPTVLHEQHLGKPLSTSWARLNELATYVVSGDEAGILIAANIVSKKSKVYDLGRGPICEVAGCPLRGKLVAVGFQKGLIIVVDIENSCSTVCQLRHHDAEILALCWAPFCGSGPFDDVDANERSDDHLLASGSRDRTIRVWSTQKGVPIATFTIPSQAGGLYRKTKEDKRNAVWITVTWPKRFPDVLISNCFSGALLSWSLRNVKNPQWSVLGAKDTSHARVIFNICCFGDIACTSSMDRQIIFWNLSSVTTSNVRLIALPTLGGFVYKLAFALINPGILAIGCGDNMIRTWNVSSPSNPYDITTLWQGVKTKVTALAWNPGKEGILAFGTEEGRVGTFNILSNKPPVIFASFHHKTVYTVSWGPPCPSEDWNINSKVFRLYSCGDGIVNVHDPSQSNEAAKNLDAFLKSLSQFGTKRPVRTEIAWDPSFEFLCLGNRDGSVEVYRASNLQLVICITSFSKLIHCLEWHPLYTLNSEQQSNYKHFLAICAKDLEVHIHDLTLYFDETNPENLAATSKIDSKEIRLLGHGAPVSSLSWSPHFDLQLVTASFDSTVRVWDVATQSTTAIFCDHTERVLCVEWSPIEPDVIFSGGEDFTLRVWRVSSQGNELSEKAIENLANYKKRLIRKPMGKKSAISKSACERPQNVAEASVLHNDLEDANSNISTKDSYEKLEKPELQEADVEKSKVLMCTDVSAVTLQSKKKKKKAFKSMFPLTNALENRGKEYALDNCISLADKLTEVPVENNAVSSVHLALYGSRIDAYKLLKAEGDNHANGDNLDYALQLEIWKGNVAGALRMAAEREQLTDWLVSLAAAVSPSLWSETCIQYAHQLVAAGQPLRAVLYLLASQRVHEAIDVLKTHVSYREAIALAKVRLPPSDPIIVRLMAEWGEQFEINGYSERAAMCFLGCGETSKAADILARKNEPKLLSAASHIAMRFGDHQQALTYAHRGIMKSLADADYENAKVLIDLNPDLKPYSVVVEIHDILLKAKFSDNCETPFHVAKRLTSEWPQTWHDFLKKTASTLSPPCTESEIAPWLSVIVTQAAITDCPEFWKIVLCAFTAVHRTGFMKWFSQLPSVFGYHILENAPSDVTAYAYLSRIHILLQQSQASNHETEAFQNVVENCSLAQRSHSCSEAYAVLKSAMVILLDEPHAKMNNLKTRLGFTKVALSSLIACQKAGKNLGTEKDSTVLLSSIPADRLIDHPGICEDGLKEECFRIEAELSNMSQNMHTHFPDPFEAAIVLADVCVSYIHICLCQNWKQELRTIVDFGEKWASLQRQTFKLEKYKEILSAESLSELSISRCSIKEDHTLLNTENSTP